MDSAHVTTRALQAFGCLAPWELLTVLALAVFPSYWVRRSLWTFGLLGSEVTCCFSLCIVVSSCPSCSAKQLCAPTTSARNHGRRLLKPLWKSHNISHTSHLLSSSSVYHQRLSRAYRPRLTSRFRAVSRKRPPPPNLRSFARRNTVVSSVSTSPTLFLSRTHVKIQLSSGNHFVFVTYHSSQALSCSRT